VTTEQPDYDTLATLPDRFAKPDPDTLATLPKGGVNLLYMGHAEVTLALLEADPCWTWEPLAFDAAGLPMIDVQGNRLTMWGYLTVCGLRRLCVGTCEARKGDPEKELIGDLLRNGAMRFGIGTKLWSKATDADPAGNASGGYGARGRKAEAEPSNEPTYSAASVALFDRVKATKGTPTADTLKAFATESGKPLTLAALDADSKYAEQVAAILDTPEVAA